MVVLMDSKRCACGCGTEIAPDKTWVRGHHWKAARDAEGLSDEKVCEECGRTYSRGDLPTRQSNVHWRQRRFCSVECSRPSVEAAQRGQVRKDEATAQAGRKRARQLYPGPHSCDVCGQPAEIHHRDGNPLNNVRENIAFLCRKHHIRAEDRMAYKRKEMTPERIAHKRALADARRQRYRERRRQEAS